MIVRWFCTCSKNVTVKPGEFSAVVMASCVELVFSEQVIEQYYRPKVVVSYKN